MLLGFDIQTFKSSLSSFIHLLIYLYRISKNFVPVAEQ